MRVTVRTFDSARRCQRAKNDSLDAAFFFSCVFFVFCFFLFLFLFSNARARTSYNRRHGWLSFGPEFVYSAISRWTWILATRLHRLGRNVGLKLNRLRWPPPPLRVQWPLRYTHLFVNRRRLGRASFAPLETFPYKIAERCVYIFRRFRSAMPAGPNWHFDDDKNEIIRTPDIPQFRSYARFFGFYIPRRDSTYFTLGSYDISLICTSAIGFKRTLGG